MHFENFEIKNELRLFRVPRKGNTDFSQSSEQVSSGKFSLKVRTGKEDWPGVVYIAHQANWSGYRNFVFSVFNPGEVKMLHLRIDDKADSTSFDNRFNRIIPLGQGWNSVKIPIEEIKQISADKTLDLTSIRRVFFFLESGKVNRIFFLDAIKLQ